MSKKNDELDIYLSRKYPSNYITGDDRCSLLIWGVPTNNGVVPKLCTLTVGADFETQNTTKKAILDSFSIIWKDKTSPVRDLYQYGKLIAQYSDLEFGIICFSTKATIDDRDNYNTEPTFLTVFSSDSKNLDKANLINGLNLKDKLLRALNAKPDNPGTSRDKNKSTADFFHDWSRDNMPSSIVKIDIDGILVNFDKGMEKILVEIKRSNIPPIPDWKPYNNDLPDFVLLFKLSELTNSEMWILHHNGLNKCTDDTIVSLFIVDTITDKGLSYSKEFREIKLGGTGNTVEAIIKESLHLQEPHPIKPHKRNHKPHR